MHIAICDDNIADRKQLERLLGRESDKRKNDTGVFYTDSYGQSETLAYNPMPYDLFFIDLTQSDPDGLTFALELCRLGVTAPIVLCSSKINYGSALDALSTPYPNLLHLQKPIVTAQLSSLLDQAIVLASNRVPTIELRSETMTLYVKEDDIVYAQAEGQYIHVHLKDGTVVPVLTNMINFYEEVAMFRHMVLLNRKIIFNIVYRKSHSPFQVTLKDGTRFSSSPFALYSINQALRLYQQES